MPEAEPTIVGPNRSWIRWLVLVLLVVGFVAFYAFGLQEYVSLGSVRANLDDLKAYVDDHLILAVIALFTIYTVMTALSVPAAWVLTLLAGALFGHFLGTGVALLAATVGATLAFLSSRFLFHDWVQARLGQRLDAFNRGVEKDGAFYLFSLRLVPIFPFFLINLGMGLTSIRTWTFFWVSLIGMLPGSFLYINAGVELTKLESAKDILSPSVIVSLALLGIAPLVFRKGMQWVNRARV